MSAPQTPHIKDQQIMTSTSTVSLPVPDTTDLERRVLAHERILQSLIAYMSRTEPRFLDHLKKRFIDTMVVAQHEHNYRDVDDYAEEFIRAVMFLGEPSTPRAPDPQEGRMPFGKPGDQQSPEPALFPDLQPDRVQTQKRSGIWEVRVDGVFWGDYHQQEHARAAAALARLSLR